MRINLAMLMLALLVCSLFAFMSSFIATTHAFTTFHGRIDQDTTWTKADSPYIITGSVFISQGATLTIESGTIIDENGQDNEYSRSSDHCIYVEGTLIAKSSVNDPITVTGYAPAIIFTPSSTSWDEQTGTGSIIENSNIQGTISINGTSPKINHNLIAYLEIKNGSPRFLQNNNIRQVFLYGGSPVLSNNWIGSVTDNAQQEGSLIITNNVIPYGLQVGGTSAIISNNEVSEITFTGHGGTAIISNNYIIAPVTYVTDNPLIPWGAPYWNMVPSIVIKGSATQVTISGNVIRNGSSGIEISATGNILIENNLIYNNTIGIEVFTSAIIHNNNLQNNAQYNIKLESTSDIDAIGNWWDTTDARVIDQKIYDNNDYYDYGTVNYTPVLQQPNSKAPNLNFNPLTAALDVPHSPMSTPEPTAQITSPPAKTNLIPTATQNQVITPNPSNVNAVYQFNLGTDFLMEAAIVVLFLVVILLLAVLIKRQPRSSGY